jgi:hypothetical protein
MRTLAALLALGLLLVLAPGAAAASNTRATNAYVRADLRLVHELVAELPALRRVPSEVLAEVRSRCPLIGEGSPQDPESTLLSDEVIGALVIRVDRVGGAAIRRFVRATQGLRWPSAAAERETGGYVRTLAALVKLPYPSLCAGVGFWRADGFTALSPFTRSFSPRFMQLWVAPGELQPALARFEGGAVRALARRAAGLEERLADWEAQVVETYTAVMNELAIYP